MNYYYYFIKYFFSLPYSRVVYSQRHGADNVLVCYSASYYKIETNRIVGFKDYGLQTSYFMPWI